MKINVPLFKQSKKNACGLTTFRSILKYNDLDFSEEELEKKVDGLKNEEGYQGALSINMATFARTLGFKINIYIYNLEIIKPEWINLSNEELIENLKKEYPARKQLSKEIISAMIDLLEAKENIRIKYPSLNDLKEYIDKQIPILISVNAGIFYEDNTLKKEGHYLIVIGYENDEFIIIDPNHTEEKRIKKDKLYLAWCINAIESTDYLLAIEK
ncbi:MAG: C39 family peptidase [Candidatus Woesearchaeota archaeon]|nr:MAG: C39 family peptidase [Candidatus Woesearchaeota archaeon]